MEHPSTTTPAATGHGAEAAQQKRDGRNEGAAMEPPPPSTMRIGVQGLESLVRRDKDMTEDPRLERRDTADSCLSDFNIQRTNTDFSVANSVATDMTAPNSPDVAFADECLDSDLAEGYASSPRRSNLFPHPVHFQRRMPFRAPSISSEADKLRALPYGSSRGTPTPQHRRLGQMASRKSSLNVSSSPTTPPAGPSSRREPSPASDLEPLAADPRIKPEGEDSTRKHAGGGSGNGGEPGFRALDTSHTPIWGAHEDAPQDRTPQEGGAEDRRMWEEEKDGCSAAKAEDEPPTPGPNVIEAGSPTAGEATFRSATPRELRPMSRCSEARDTCEEEDAPPTPSPDDGMILEVCEQILQHAFGVQFHELALAGALSAAYESVSYCLAELSHIVHDSGLGDRGIVISESTRGSTGSGGVPIWPAEGVASSVGSGSGSGGSSQGQGNGGGGRKRSNGAESGDGTGDGSPGGGKRQKVSANAQPTADIHFSCPFRKRNPVRFNIRKSPNCALQSFPDFSQLKRHVKNFHKQTPLLPFTCPRCRLAMGSQEALSAHLSVDKDQICNFNKEPSSADPEDGITLQMEEALNGRKADRKIDCWGGLWRHLFPHDVEVPESDFIPPTELDEVYAEFSSHSSTHQLRQCIRERLGPAADDGVFAAVWSHIESVFEACRAKTGGTAGNRRRGPPQTPRQMTSLQASVRLNPGRPALGSQGSGRSDSSISSPVATPTSSNMLGNPEQPSTVNPQLQMPYAPPPPVSSYPGAGHDVSGAATMAFIRRGSVAGQGGGPIVVAPPAHVHPGFNNQAQETVGVMGSQVGHPPLVPMDSGMGLNCGFLGQGTGDFTGGSPFGAHNDFANEGFVPALSTNDLCLRLLSHETQGIQGQMLSPTDPSISGIPFYNPSNVEQKHFGEGGPSGEQWR